jgi:phenylalanyl-tRNA synthetase beta chain
VKVSYRWLARHVDLDGLTAAQCAELLTVHTAEVEGVERFAPALANVVVGHVLAREKHPDADKLSVCRVDLGPASPAGERAPLQIVCGAPNVAAGQRVAVARVGTALGELVIKKSKIRGVESQGMICSERELGLGDEHAGIWVLSADAQLGSPVDRALGLEDWTIEIDNKSITHRPDLWGHRGLAGELAALTGRTLRPLELALPAPPRADAARGTPYPVRVESPACPRYLALPIDGVVNGRSPDWLRFLLLAAGQRPIDLLVDLSNFVMLDLGQPNHVFDRARLPAQEIVVREARPGERMATLDGVERALEPQDLLICAGAEPVALAGVMGGEASKVAPETRDVLLEVACFHPTRVRRTAARLALRTDASARFEKNLSPTLVTDAAAHFARLLAELQPAVRFPRPPGDAGDWQDPALTLALRCERVRSVLGADIPDARIAAILRALGFAVRGAGVLEVEVPSARATKDIRIEEDLIEEVGRVHGYGRVAERVLTGELRPPPRDERRALVRALQDELAGAARFHEAQTHSFQDEGLLATLKLLELPYVPIVNPIVASESRVRRSVVPSLIGLVAKNRRERAEVRLFEVGKGYLPEEPSARGEPRERHHVGLTLAAPRAAPDAGARFDAGAFLRLKGVVEAALSAAGRRVDAWSEEGRGAEVPYVHPRRWLAAVSGGERVAWLGGLDPLVQRELGLVGELESDVAVAEVALDALLSVPAAGRRYRPIGRFPGQKIDVALALAEDVPVARVVETIERAGKKLVQGVELFDLYRGEKLGAGKKSLAFHVLLQAEDRTLDDQDGAKFLERLARAATELGWELRRE